MSYTPPVGNATASKPGLIQLAGDLGGGGSATSPVITGYAKAASGGAETVVTANTGASYSIDLSTGNVFFLTLTSATVTLSITGAASGKACSFTLYLKQDATGSRVVTWPSGTKWSGGAPTLTSTANAVDVVVMESVLGNAGPWYASLVGANFA